MHVFRRGLKSSGSYRQRTAFGSRGGIYLSRAELEARRKVREPKSVRRISLREALGARLAEQLMRLYR